MFYVLAVRCGGEFINVLEFIFGKDGELTFDCWTAGQSERMS